ncbi:MAG TPA: ABC transporter substrate-binding protein [Acidimicrobiales bacterium]
MRQPTPLRVFTAITVALTLIAAACGDDDGDTATGDGAPERDGPAISIGAQDFGESAILAEIYAQALEAEGFDTRIQEVGGFRDLLFGALESGDINLAPEYVASELEFLNDNAGEATSDVDETFDLLQPYLEERGLVGLTPSDAVDTNAFAVTEETADELDLRTLSDLADHQDLTLGAPPDCETNPFCIPGLQDVYGVDLSGNFTPLDFGVIPTSLEEGAVDIGVMLSTDGRLADEGFVLLEDDQQMLAADNIFPVLTQDLVDAYGDDLTDVLDGISADLTTEGVTELNRRYDVENEDAEDIAADWLADR